MKHSGDTDGRPGGRGAGPGRLFVLTGGPGAGKSTRCRQVVRAAREAGLVVRGVVQADEPVPGGVERRLEDLRTGARFLLGRAAPPEAVAAGVPRWTLEDAALERCAAILHAACPADLLVIDEVGPLELVHDRGAMAGVRAALAGPCDIALVVVRPWLVRRFRQVFPEPAADVIDVCEEGAFGRLLAAIVVRPPA
jgi:nucleoside-triphosphatase